MKHCQFIILLTLLFCVSCTHHQVISTPPASGPSDTPDKLLSSDSRMPVPPVAEVHPYSKTVHGKELQDEYHWLTDKTRTDPGVIAYLEAENDYTKDILKHLQPVKNEFFKEMIGRMKETDRFVPTRRDDYYYYTRTEEGLEYGIQCRRKGSMDAPEEITLDINKIAKDHDYTFVSKVRYSPDHKFVAYTVDHSGDERYELFVKSLET
ncbi:hypothetical protein K8T06_08355, partial [bacterium]|nr:hypothetical protein [bacterium]